MKKILMFLAVLLPALTLRALPGLEKYTVVYSAQAEAEEGLDVAQAVAAVVLSRTGVEPAIVSDTEPETRYEILVGSTSRKQSQPFYKAGPDSFDWELSRSGNKVLVCGGGCWALMKAADELRAGGIPRKSLKGNIYGEFLFPREEGTSLRILDDNIWDYGKPDNAPAWEALGADCRDEVRARGLIELVHAYEPDILTMQEYSSHMDKIMRPLLLEKGYSIAYEPDAVWNHTPIFYKPSVLTLHRVKYHKYEPATWCNHGTKSYCSAIFSLNASGREFMVINTHLWWKSEKAQVGSDEARTAQVRKMMTEVDDVVQERGCPVFMMGDMNCKLESKAMKQLLAAGYTPLFKAATVYGDPRNGYHMCSAKGFSRACSWTDEDGLGAIDQFFIYNGAGEIFPGPVADPVEVLVFRRIYARFTVAITDHYPNYADIKL